jgi:hypothetical protein
MRCDGATVRHSHVGTGDLERVIECAAWAVLSDEVKRTVCITVHSAAAAFGELTQTGRRLSPSHAPLRDLLLADGP